MKAFKIYILLLLLAFSAFSQPPDTLISNLFKSGNTFYNQGYYDSALTYYLKAENLSKKYKKTKLLSNILYRQIAVYYRLNDFKTLRFKIDTALEIAPDTATKVNIYNALAALYSSVGIYNKAFNIFSKLADFYKKQKNYRLLARSLVNIGAVYGFIGEYDSALIYTNKALKYFRIAGDSNSVAQTYLNLGEIYLKAHKYQKAQNALLYAQYLAQKLPLYFIMPYVYLNLAQAALLQHKYHQAINFLIQGIKFFNSPTPLITRLYSKLALSYAYLNYKNKALQYIDSTHYYMNRYPQLEISSKLEVYHDIYKTYRLLNQADSALVYLERYYNLKEKINSAKQSNEIEILLTEQNIRHTQQQLKSANKILILTKTIILLLLIVTIIFIVGGIKLRQINKKLRQALFSNNYKIILYQTLQLFSASSETQTLAELIPKATQLLKSSQLPWANQLQYISLLIIDPNVNKFNIITTGKNAEKLKICEQYTNSPLITQAINERKTNIITSIPKDHPCYELLKNYKLVIIPLVYYNRTLGLAMFIFSNKFTPSKEDIEFLNNFSIQISAFVHNCQKRKKLEETLDNLNGLNEKLFANNLLLEKQKYELQKANEKIEQQSEKLRYTVMQIQNSIKAATHLINSMLPSQDFLKSLFKDLFLIYLSKNIIGGDFYFALKIDQFIFWGVGDAVGHGTEGALLAAQILSQIKYYIALYPYEKPSKILQFLDEFIKRTYTQNHEKKFITVDGIILKYNTATRELIFSSALQSPVIARNKTALIIQTPKAYLGYHLRKTTFTDTKILLEPNDIIYTFTDGIYDQISADNRHKYTKTRFLELIQNICDKPLEQQKQIILNEFYQWKKDFPQTDDVTVFTVKPI